MSNSTAEMQNGMHAPDVTHSSFENCENDSAEKCINLIGTIKSDQYGSVQSSYWVYEPHISCYIICDFGDTADSPIEIDFNVTSDPNFSGDQDVDLKVYTAKPNPVVDEGSSNPPAKTSRGVVVRVQTGSGGI